MPTAAVRVLLATGVPALLTIILVTGWTLAQDFTGTQRTAGAHAQATEAPTRTAATGRAPIITHPGERAYVLKPVRAVSFDSEQCRSIHLGTVGARTPSS